MNILYRFFLILCFTLNTTAQIGIGTVTPEGALDIRSTKHGVLLPRVNLSNLNNQSPITNPKGANLVMVL